jgi:hypothetical protein
MASEGLNQSKTASGRQSLDVGRRVDLPLSSRSPLQRARSNLDRTCVAVGRVGAPQGFHAVPSPWLAPTLGKPL